MTERLAWERGFGKQVEAGSAAGNRSPVSSLPLRPIYTPPPPSRVPRSAGYEDAYVPGTCQELLKWKFPHMNSVDFRLRWDAAAGVAGLELLETRAGGPRSRGYHLLPGATISFPGGEDPALFHQRIVEAAFDADAHNWVFMRERRDKATPNAYHVYESVARSIADNIEEEQLLASIHDSLRLPLYERDRSRSAGVPSAAAAPAPPTQP